MDDEDYGVLYTMNPQNEEMEEARRKLENERMLGKNKVIMLMKTKEKEAKAKASKLRAEIQSFHMYEAFCESAPQFILQVVGMVFTNDFPPSTIISTIISCGNVVITASKIYLKIPVISSTNAEEQPFNSWANLVITVPMILLTTAPRFMTFILFFSNVPMRRSKINVPIFLGTFVIYTCVFWIGARYLLRRKFHERLLQSFMTSPFSPCIVMDPSSRLLIFSSICSTLAHMVLLAVCTLHAFHPALQSEEEKTPDSLSLYISTWVLLTIVSPIASIFLHWFSNFDNRQWLGLKVDQAIKCVLCCKSVQKKAPLISLCCEKEEVFHWACEKGSKKTLNHILQKKGPSMKEEEANRGFYLAVTNGRLNTVKVLIQARLTTKSTLTQTTLIT